MDGFLFIITVKPLLAASAMELRKQRTCCQKCDGVDNIVCFCLVDLMEVVVGLIWGSPDLSGEGEESRGERLSEGDGGVKIQRMEVMKWEVELGR